MLLVNVKSDIGYGVRDVTRAELIWKAWRKRCREWHLINAPERINHAEDDVEDRMLEAKIQQILERQAAQEQHEAAQRKRVSNGRLNEMRRRDLTEYGEDDEFSDNQTQRTG
jgi:hypothetical protein